MRDSRKCVLASALCLVASWSVISCVSSVPVSAAVLPADGRLMTYQEAVDCFGTSIPVRYLDRTGVYHDETATLVSNNAPYKIGQTSYIDSESYLVENRGIVLYEFHTEYSTPVNITPAQVTVRLQPEYSIFDTEFIYTAIGISTDTDTSLAAYNSPTWSWVYAGQTVVFDSVATATNNVLPNFYLKNAGGYFVSTASGNTKFNFVPAYMTSQSVTSGYSTEATFDHVWGNSSGGIQTIYIAIGFPYVSSGASGATGTIGTTTATTTAASSVDLGETNGLLGGISSAISGLVTKIQNIYNIVSGDDISITDAEELVSQPDDIDYEEVLEDADQILEDVPEVVAGGAVYWDLFGRLFAEQVDGRANPAVLFVLLIPFAALLSLVSYLFWRG